jgi:hypothetical protein
VPATVRPSSRPTTTASTPLHLLHLPQVPQSSSCDSCGVRWLITRVSCFVLDLFIFYKFDFTPLSPFVRSSCSSTSLILLSILFAVSLTICSLTSSQSPLSPRPFCLLQSQSQSQSPHHVPRLGLSSSNDRPRTHSTGVRHTARYPEYLALTSAYPPGNLPSDGYDIPNVDSKHASGASN